MRDRSIARTDDACHAFPRCGVTPRFVSMAPISRNDAPSRSMRCASRSAACRRRRVKDRARRDNSRTASVRRRRTRDACARVRSRCARAPMRRRRRVVTAIFFVGLLAGLLRSCGSSLFQEPIYVAPQILKPLAHGSTANEALIRFEGSRPHNGCRRGNRQVPSNADAVAP